MTATERQRTRSEPELIHEMLKTIALESVGSTNSYLKALPPEPDEDWTLVTAQYQEAGRGAGQNHWESQAGRNLLLSLRIHPISVQARDVFVLSEALALSIRRALQEYAEGFLVKWPNDLYHQDRKVAGLLIENSMAGTVVGSTIMGVGLNVNQTHFLSDAPNPVSLAQILGHEVPISEVLERFLQQFRIYYNKICAREYLSLHHEYLSHLYRRTGLHPFRDRDGQFRASIADVEPDGHLILRDTAGRLRRYAFKEVESVLQEN